MGKGIPSVYRSTLPFGSKKVSKLNFVLEFWPRNDFHC